MDKKVVNKDVKACKETDIKVCSTCTAIENCPHVKEITSDSEFHRELITEQHSCG